MVLSLDFPNRKSCDTSQNFPMGHTKFLAWLEYSGQLKNPTCASGTVCAKDGANSFANVGFVFSFARLNFSCQRHQITYYETALSGLAVEYLGVNLG